MGLSGRDEKGEVKSMGVKAKMQQRAKLCTASEEMQRVYPSQVLCMHSSSSSAITTASQHLSRTLPKIQQFSLLAKERCSEATASKGEIV